MQINLVDIQYRNSFAGQNLKLYGKLLKQLMTWSIK